MMSIPKEFKNIKVEDLQPHGILMEGIPSISPPFRQFKQFKITKQFTYISQKGLLVQSREDKLTDLASVPGFLRPLLKIPGRETVGAIGHDEGYSAPLRPRYNVITGVLELAGKNDWDDIFDALNRMGGVSLKKRLCLNGGLNVGGWYGWNDNKSNNPNTLSVPILHIKNLEIIK